MGEPAYRSFRFTAYDTKDREINSWTLEPPEPLSNDLVAGLIAPLDEVFHQLGHKGRIVVNIDDKELDTDLDPLIVQLGQDYYRYVDYKHERIPEISEDYLCWWGTSPGRTNGILDLYVFRTPDFIRGFISMCNACQVDFRNYILGPPFEMINETNQFYSITGYDISPIPPEILVDLQPGQ